MGSLSPPAPEAVSPPYWWGCNVVEKSGSSAGVATFENPKEDPAGLEQPGLCCCLCSRSAVQLSKRFSCYSLFEFLSSEWKINAG